MNAILKSSSTVILALSLLALPVHAQDSGSGDGAASGDLAMGETVGPEDAAVGATYVREVHGDWTLQCLKTETGDDPCQLYQLIRDDQGTPMSEVKMFEVPEGGQAVAAATIAVPLETLLTQELTLSVDGGTAKRYPFSYCTIQGCFARIGLTLGDLNAFKRGSTAEMFIVPVARPDVKVNLKMSLAGFTAGYAAVVANNKAIREKGGN